MRILIVGLSTRAIAESAVRSEHQIVTVDYFGDRDQRALVENVGLQRDFDLPFSAEGLLQASRSLDFDAAVYVSNLENHPDLVEELAQRALLLGNTPSVLRHVRDWQLVRAFCHDEKVSCPTTLLAGEEKAAHRRVRWLRKPVRSGGGHGIRPWAGEPLDGSHLLQAYVKGQPGSAAFVADGQRCVLLGLTEQLIGRGELGARGFAWCGNILPLGLPEPERQAIVGSVREMAEKLTRRFGLRGVNGLDFVLGRDAAGRPAPYLVEVNPRYTASMELIEWAYGLDMFGLHLRSFDGELPPFWLEENLQRPGFYGKGIVYAAEGVVMPETAHWRAKGRRDLPFPGEKIESHHPICTVLVRGESRDDCWNRLMLAVEAVYQESRGRGRDAAPADIE